MKDLIPKEGATGWADTWMLSAQGEASELRVHVDEVGLDAEGAGAAGDLLRRDAGQPEGLPDHGQAVKRARARSTTAARRRRTSTRSSSGRRRSPTAATARRTAWTTRSGSRPGRRSRASAGSSAAESDEAGPPLRAARLRLSAALLAAPLGEGGCCCYAAAARVRARLSRWRSSRCSSRRSGRSTRSRPPRKHIWTLDNFRTICRVDRLPHDRSAHDRHRGRRHGHGRPARVPARVLHGARRVAGARARFLFVAVLLPLWSSYLVARLHLAADPRRGRRAQLDHSARSACRTGIWLLRTGRSGSSSRTSGCRS